MNTSNTEDINNELEPFTRLIEVMRDDSVINQKVIKMLRLDSYPRHIVLSNWLEQLRRNNAPTKLIQSLACLFDDSTAEKVRTLINDHQIKTTESD